jgi:hypothetical protein
MHCSKKLFDYLVGQREYLGGNFDPQRLGGLAIDNKFELGRLQHRQVSGPGAFEDAAGVDSDLAIHVEKTCAVAHQAASRCKVAVFVDSGNPIPIGQRNDSLALADKEIIGNNKQRVGVQSVQSGEGCIQLALSTDVQDLDLLTKGACCLLDVSSIGLRIWIDAVREDPNL